MIVVLMGVTGSGKTTIGRLLAARTGWQFVDGDDYHSAENRRKMNSGTPLTDEDRGPWLESLHRVLAGWLRRGESGILACSALKRSYRDTLADGISNLRFVLLEAPREILAERLATRAGHFMNPALLSSQIETLEAPARALHIAVTGKPEDAVESLLEGLKH